MWFFIVDFQNSYAIIIVMKASYKEAGRTRKWLFSVLAVVFAIVSLLMPVFKSANTYAASSYDLVVRMADGGILKTISLGSDIGDGGNYVARVNASGNGRYSITIENNLTGQVLGTVDNISPDRITSNNSSSFASADFNYRLELWQDGGTVASGTPISVSGGLEKRAWVIAEDEDGDGTYDVSYSQPTGEGYTSMTDASVNQQQIGDTVPGNAQAPIVAANDDPPSDEDKKSVKEKCISSGAAGSLGWIVCPIMVFLADTSTDLYDAIEPMLSVSSDSFNQSADLFKAWQMFQQFANVAFVILFMVVVISQITGVGINNYGIKKILPKLIVAAVLVNVSYWLCIIAADVSNIVGNSIQNLLNGLGPALPTDYTSVEVSAGAVTAVTAVPILAALVGGGVAIALNPAILLGLLISAIGLVISLLTLLVLLAAREAVIVVLIVISPIAFVCYMLPNTKKAFDKWLKIGEAMLLVYPTCGLMVGAGNFVSKLLLNGGITISGTGKIGAFVGAFVALLVGIVPIFFIPSVIKKSFAAAGDLGTKISGIGKNIGGRAQNAARNSALNREAQRRGMERRTRITAGIGTDGKPKEMGRMGKILRGGERNIADARAQFLKDQTSRFRSDSMNGTGFDAAQVDQKKAFEKEELGQWITLVNDKTRNGEDEDTLFAMYDEAMAENNKTKAVAVARIAGRRKDTAARFLGEKITGATLAPPERPADPTDAAKMAEYNKRLATYNNRVETLAENQRLINEDDRRGIFQGVAKEIATGESSGAYRESSPLGFEFAAMHNRDANVQRVDANGQPIPGVSEPLETNYANWRDAGVLHDALDKYVTDSKSLVGLKGSTLKEFHDSMLSGTMNAEDQAMLRQMATDAINNRDKGPWDYTKAETLCKISGQFSYNPATKEITRIAPSHNPTMDGGGGQIRGAGGAGGGNGANPGAGIID